MPMLLRAISSWVGPSASVFSAASASRRCNIRSGRILSAALAAALLPATFAPALETSAERTRQLLTELQSGSNLFDRARACQQLGEIGDASAVPALAALLGDEHLAAYARSGLEGIPDPAAAAALRKAAQELTGAPRIGAINSLAALRDDGATDLLIALSADPAADVSTAALRALGRIASGPALARLRDALPAATSETARADAEDACLLAAEQLRAKGQDAAAAELYDLVRGGEASANLRTAATLGAVAARKTNGVPLLMDSLRSEDPAVRVAGLQAIREIPCEALARALNAELAVARPDMLAVLVAALADCHDASSPALLRSCAAAEDGAVRVAALRALGSIGGADDVEVLLAAAGRADESEADVAINSLSRLGGVGVDAKLIEAFSAAEDPQACLRLATLLEIRNVVDAVPALLRRASDPDPKLAAAALRVLKAVAPASALPDLVPLLRGATNAAARDAMLAAFAAICERTDAAAAGSSLAGTLLAERDPAPRCAGISILTSLGRSESLPLIERLLKDADETVAAHAARELGRWPDAAPADALLALAAGDAPAPVRQRAFASAIQLVGRAAESGREPPARMMDWLQRCMAGCGSDAERLQVISAAGHVPGAASVRLIAPCLDAAATCDAAALGIARLAAALPPADAAPIRDVIARAVGFVQDPEARGAAEKQLASLAPAPAGAALFDGQTLAGWEGDTNVWRVRDGIIIGGSLQGNARNDFLATTRAWTNFVLHLEYKLVGTEGFVNGGVQFHSLRTPQPPNEMSGYQADIGAGYTGALYDETRRNKVLARPPAEQLKRLEKAGDWNRYQVRCTGGHIELFLNGERTVDYTEPESAIPQEGLIALQIHGGAKSEISFRNIRLEELP